MDCSFINNHLAAIAENALDAKQMELCRAHIGQCSACARLLGQFEKAWQTDPAEQLEPSGNFYYKVMEKAAQKSTIAQYIENALQSWQLILQPVAATALLALGIWFGAVLGTGSSATQTSLASADEFDDDYYSVLSVFPQGSSGEFYQEISQNQQGDTQ